jgi:hypothetical protein
MDAAQSARITRADRSAPGQEQAPMATKKPTTRKPTTKDVVDTAGNMPSEKADAGDEPEDTEGNRIKLIRESGSSAPPFPA